MPTTLDEPNAYTKLRGKAEALLQAGATPTAGHWSLGADALSLLHRLSSNPDKAEDALKLLHELQVHQVELDLQNEAIVANEQAIEEDLRLYQTLYACAPLAYCVVDLEGAVFQSNPAATELFGTAMEGQRIDTFLSPQTRPSLKDLLERVARSGSKGACIAQMEEAAHGSRHLQFLASTPPGREHILLACCEYGHVE